MSTRAYLTEPAPDNGHQHSFNVSRSLALVIYIARALKVATWQVYCMDTIKLRPKTIRRATQTVPMSDGERRALRKDVKHAVKQKAAWLVYTCG